MKHLRISLSLISVAVALLSLPAVLQAQENNACRPLFGGGPSCVQSGNLTLDKKLRHPQNTDFIDHLDSTDPKFAPGQQVVFQLQVRNTGNRAINNVLVTDIMPQYVSHTKGPGTYDKETNILSHTIEKLEAGQTQTVTIEGKVVPQTALPNSSGALCVVNQASATQARNTGSDNAQFCIQTAGQAGVANVATPAPVRPGTPPVLPIPNTTTTPSTGPEMLALFSLIPATLGGFYLRKHAR